MLKTLVALFSFGGCMIGTPSTGELAGIRCWLALDPPKTRLSTAHICSFLTELPTESFWTQTSRYLEIRRLDNHDSGNCGEKTSKLTLVKTEIYQIAKLIAKHSNLLTYWNNI